MGLSFGSRFGMTLALLVFSPLVAAARPCAFDADCSDGLPCTADRCLDGRCEHPAGESGCDDGNECTKDACVSDRCEHIDGPAGCDDGNACTADACVNGRCENATNDALTCTDGNECTRDTCVGGRCDHSSAALAAGCDDGNACTVDSCVGVRCQHDDATATACDDGNACTLDTCVAGRCEHTAADATSSCNDGDVCTVDSCVNGRCEHAAAAPCDDGNPCTADVCDPRAGCTFAPNDGAPCAVSSVCGVGLCEAGVCTVHDVAVSDSCGDVPVAGFCDGHTLRRCADGQPTAIDCTVAGGACGFDTTAFDGAGGFDCIPVDYVPCAGIPDSGVCVGNVVSWCDKQTGKTETWDCATDGTACGWTGEFYCCHAPEACVPMCQDRACGPDGCGGVCGACEGENVCSANGTCLPCAEDGAPIGDPTGDASKAPGLDVRHSGQFGCQSSRSAPSVLSLVALLGLAALLRRRTA